jgi:hypothetical protein
LKHFCKLYQEIEKEKENRKRKGIRAKNMEAGRRAPIRPSRQLSRSPILFSPEPVHHQPLTA